MLFYFHKSRIFSSLKSDRVTRGWWTDSPTATGSEGTLNWYVLYGKGWKSLEKELLVSQYLNPRSLNPESKPFTMAATLLLSVDIMNKQCKRQGKTPSMAVEEMNTLHFICIQNAQYLWLAVKFRKAYVPGLNTCLDLNWSKLMIYINSPSSISGKNLLSLIRRNKPQRQNTWANFS